MAFKARFAALEGTNGAGRHINVDATLRIKCGRPHFMRESRLYGSVRGALGNERPLSQRLWPIAEVPVISQFRYAELPYHTLNIALHTT